MHKVIATLAVACFSLLVFAVPANAAPTEVEVRIEGRSETIFEGPVVSEPHGVRAASDKIKKLRRCDGINLNDPLNTVPALTPTAAAADAMTMIGESFDGQWYSQYEDYFVTRWGPDAQDPGDNAYWGILVNDVFTNVGGCQYQLDGGDEVLWVYDAFKERPTLALFPEAMGYSSGPRPLTVKGVAPGQSVPVEVVSFADDQEDNPPATPSRLGSSPYEGAKVAPVITTAQGSERVEAAAGIATDAQGKASVSYTEPGWHRVKATVGSPGAESVIRSNRLDICVSGSGGATLEGASNCAELPAADRPRVATPTVGEIEGQPAATTSTPSGGNAATPSEPSPGSVRVTLPRLDRRQLDRGWVGVSWRVLSSGAGIKRWWISSLRLDRRSARYVNRATGTKATEARVRLPAGGSYRLRFTLTDALGRSSTTTLGEVSVPAPRHPRHR